MVVLSDSLESLAKLTRTWKLCKKCRLSHARWNIFCRYWRSASWSWQGRMKSACCDVFTASVAELFKPTRTLNSFDQLDHMLYSKSEQPNYFPMSWVKGLNAAFYIDCCFSILSREFAAASFLMPKWKPTRNLPRDHMNNNPDLCRSLQVKQLYTNQWTPTQNS